MRDFRDRVAVVTGAASGIGRALAQALGRRGARLALVDVNEAGLEEVARELRERGGRVSLHVADVSDRARMAELPGEVAAEHGGVSLLVNNAGVSVAGTLEEQSFDDLDWILGINLWGVIHGCKFFLPLLRREREAHIVNLSSMLGLVGFPGQSSYCASKFAVRGLSEALWVELRDAGIGVTCVHPGGVATQIARDARGIAPADRARMVERFAARGLPPERAAERILRGVERRRMRVVICPEAHVTAWLKRIAPVASQYGVLALWRRVGPQSGSGAGL
jgi:NAD(P)-dependent dehydrogenase (short-subunit alcohol dehydrogenase family)